MRLMVLWCFTSMPVQFQEGSEARAAEHYLRTHVVPALMRPRQGVIVAWLSVEAAINRGNYWSITR